MAPSATFLADTLIIVISSRADTEVDSRVENPVQPSDTISANCCPSYGVHTVEAKWLRRAISHHTNGPCLDIAGQAVAVSSLQESVVRRVAFDAVIQRTLAELASRITFLTLTHRVLEETILTPAISTLKYSIQTRPARCAGVAEATSHAVWGTDPTVIDVVVKEATGALAAS